jgi:hypothetical protein
MKVSPERKFPRDLSRWELPVYEFSDLDAFEGSPQQQTGVYAIPLGPGYLEALVQLRPGKPLVLFFHGTTRREKNI